jgi:hypothetical protein
MTPGVAGALSDQRADMDDVIATILDLAVRGHVRIVEVPPEIPLGLEPDSFAGKILGGLAGSGKDWELVRLQPGAEAGLRKFERETLRAVFDGAGSRKLSALKNQFYKDLPGIKEALYGELVEQRLFPRSPDSTRKLWIGLAIGTLVVGVGLGILATQFGYWTVIPAMVFSALFILGFGWQMPAVTSTGALARREVEGLREYIRRAEKAEIEFRDAPERTPELFSQLLP